MEGIPMHNKLPEEIELKLQQKISYAKEHCLTLEEEKQINEKLIEGTIIQNKRELTDEEVEYYYSFRDRLDQASVVVDTINEAKRVMELIGFTDDSTIDTLEHENAHANKAMQLGANFGGYKFSIVRDIDGGYLITPMAITSIPDDWSDKKREEVETQIIKAPEEYGNRMSEADKQELKIKYGK